MQFYEKKFSLIKPETIFWPNWKSLQTHYFRFPVIIVTDIIFIKFLKSQARSFPARLLFDVEFDLTFLKIKLKTGVYLMCGKNEVNRNNNGHDSMSMLSAREVELN